MADLKLSKKSILYLKIAGVLLMAGIAVVFVYLPSLDSAKNVKVKINDLESELSISENLLKSYEGKEGVTLLPEKDASLMLDDIINLCSANNIKLVVINPKEIYYSDEYACSVYPLEISVEARYKDLGNFLHSIENIKKSIVKIKSFYVERDEKISPKVKAKIALDIYLKAD